MDEKRKRLLSDVTAKPRLGEDPRDFLPKAARSGFQLGSLGETIGVWKAMLEDPDAVVYLGLAGAVVPAGFGPLLGECLRHNMVDVVVSTGAQVYHDLYEAVQGDHFKLKPGVTDHELNVMNVDRIYDVVADDIDYQDFDERIAERLDGFPPSRDYITPVFLETLVRSFENELRGRDSMVVSALDARVPIFMPTLFDASTSFALVLRRHRDGATPVNVDFTEDLYQQYRIFREARKTGGIYIGGGVPKNHIQQLHPLVQVVEGIYGHQEDSGHDYGIQFTADQPVWGGLSGCTMEESESWGKYHGSSMRAVCYGDATINFYLAACTVFKEMEGTLAKRKPRRLMERLPGV